MDSAYNFETKKLVSALFLEKDLSYELIEKQKWLIDVSEVINYDKEKVEDINLVEVIYRKATNNITNKFGHTYNRAPHFYIPNREKLGINIIPESKEHKQLKNWIYTKILDKNLIFQYSKTLKNESKPNLINITDWDIDYSNVDIEYYLKGKTLQRADILIPFKERDKFFGCGIVIEVQLSKKLDRTTMKRNNEYAFKGYSVCWLFKSDIEEMGDQYDIETKEIEFYIEIKQNELRLYPLSVLIDEWQEQKILDLRILAQDISRKLDEKFESIENPKILGSCPKCFKGYFILKKGSYGEFYGCSYYPVCKNILKL